SYLVITVLSRALTSSLPIACQPFPPKYSHRRILPVVCYYEKGQALRPSPADYDIDDVPGQLCSHVNLAYIELDEQTWRVKEDSTVNFTRFNQIKRKFPRLKTFLSIGGWNNQTSVISTMALEDESRRLFVDGVAETLTQLNLDGLDLFWLFPGHTRRGGRAEDKANLILLLKKLRRVFRKRGLLLTIAVPLNTYILDAGYNVPEIVRYVDWINAIGYDLRGIWNDRTDIHSPLYPRSIDSLEMMGINVQEGMQALLDRGAVKRKVLLGIAFYGRVYRLADPTIAGLHSPIDNLNRPQAGAFLRSDHIQAYLEICLNLKSGPWTRYFDAEGQCPYATNGEDWVGYEDKQSIGQKVDFVRREGYAGFMVFSCDMDDFRGLCGARNGLLQVINNGIPRERPQIIVQK
ncbi:unnamed protein product, partial [Ixodes hexagonus]